MCECDDFFIHWEMKPCFGEKIMVPKQLFWFYFYFNKTKQTFYNGNCNFIIFYFETPITENFYALFYIVSINFTECLFSRNGKD